MACGGVAELAEGGGLLNRHIVPPPPNFPNIFTDLPERASRVTRTVTRSAMGRIWHNEDGR